MANKAKQISSILRVPYSYCRPNPQKWRYKWERGKAKRCGCTWTTLAMWQWTSLNWSDMPKNPHHKLNSPRIYIIHIYFFFHFFFLSLYSSRNPPSEGIIFSYIWIEYLVYRNIHKKVCFYAWLSLPVMTHVVYWFGELSLCGGSTLTVLHMFSFCLFCFFFFLLLLSIIYFLPLLIRERNWYSRNIKEKKVK